MTHPTGMIDGSTVKTQADYFRDWKSHFIGYGYGSGELYTIPALRTFLELCNEGPRGTSYDYAKLEAALGGATAWFLISSILAKADIIEYGTSPRFAWLTRKGERLKAFVRPRTNDELLEIVCGHDESYAHCYPTACNCGPNGYEKSRVCNNPFWREP